MFGNCFPNTLDTTVEFGVVNGRPDDHVITGDIDAIWLHFGELVLKTFNERLDILN